MIKELDATITELKRLDSQYSDLLKTKLSLAQRVWGVCARFIGSGEDGKLDKPRVKALEKKILGRNLETDNPLFIISEPFVCAHELIETEQVAVRKKMEKLAGTLPVSGWVREQKGAGQFNLARLIANAGRDLTDYATPPKLWSRFGLHVVNGAAPEPIKGETLGFSRARRAIAHNLGESLLRGRGYWKTVYDARKKYEVEQAEAAGLTVVPAAKIPKKDAKHYRSEGHVHKRALRYTQKKFIEALWQEWTGSKRDMNLPEFITKETA